MNKHITLKRKEEAEDFYFRLQQKAIKNVQRYSGNIWTDFNAHDPGVTMLEIVNYALLETDYRLQFELQDYLNPSSRQFIPALHGLFSPADVYMVAPVSVTDYRKLIISVVDNIKNVWINPDVRLGQYNFILAVDAGITNNRKNDILKEVRRLYHENRNLCENIGTIRFLRYENLTLKADIELEKQANQHLLLAKIYAEVEDFLNPGIHIRETEILYPEGKKNPEQILDRSHNKGIIMDDQALYPKKNTYDLTLLFSRIHKINGIKQINYFELYNQQGNPVDHLVATDELQGYTVIIPETNKELSVKLRKNGSILEKNAEKLNRNIYQIFAGFNGISQRNDPKRESTDFPGGKFINKFSHHPLKNDLPECYGKADQLKEYLHFFDEFIEEILTEINEIPQWMRLDTQHLPAQKEQWLDILDDIYGTESNPEFLRNNETPEENRTRRIHFLKDIPEWGYKRGSAANLLKFPEQSISGIEKYVSRLFNLPKYGLEIFVLEHNLLQTTQRKDNWNQKIFEISFVLSSNNDWLIQPEFRKCCEQVILSRTPAHISIHIYWAHKQTAKKFRREYSFWIYLQSTPNKVGLQELTDKLIKRLEDDNYWYGKV